MKAARISLITVFVLGLIALVLRLMSPEWGGPEGQLLSWDVLGYYLYLPAEFIYDDLDKLAFAPEIIDQYQNTATFYQANQVGENWVMKYTMGMSLAYLPFFFLGHFCAYLGGYPMDGFSAPYQVCIAIGSIVYLIIGLWVLRRVLLLYFSDKWTAILLGIVFLGTNLLQFGVWKCAMPHSYLFALYAGLLWFTIKWHKVPSWRSAATIGAILGLLMLIRPSEIIACVIPLLWNIGSKAQLQEKWRLIKKQYPHFIVLVVAVLLVWAPQLFYWKSVSGNWLHYTYGEETFHFSRPHIYNVLFSFKKGWLIYTPIMALALIGFVVLWKKNRPLFWPLAIFTLLNLYIIASWSNWWYASSYGHRAFIQSYVLMIIPLGFLLRYVWQQWGKIGKVLLIIPLLMVGLNLFQLWQYHHQILHHSRMTKDYYWAVFLKTKAPAGSAELLGPRGFPDPRTEFIPTYGHYSISTVSTQPFEQNTIPEDRSNSLSGTRVMKGETAFAFNGETKYAPGIKYNLEEMRGERETWVRSTVYYYAESIEDIRNLHFNVVCNSMGRVFKYESIPLDSASFVPGAWNAISLECILPESRYSDDFVQTFVWDGEGELRNRNVFLDEMRLERLVKKPFYAPDRFRHVKAIDFEDVLGSTPSDSSVKPHGGEKAYHMTPDQRYSPVISVPVTQLQQHPSEAIRVMYHVLTKDKMHPEGIQLVASFENNGEVLKEHSMPHSWHVPPGYWHWLSMDINMPEDLPDGTVLKVYLHNSGKEDFWIDDAAIQLLQPKTTD